MDTSLIIPFLELLQSLPAETLAFLTFMCCAASILLLFRLFGAVGLYLYNTIMVIVANIQVLKMGTFWFLPEPVALGTIAFASTYLATDIITEHCGKAVARKGVWISFAGHILMTFMMILTLGFSAPVDDKVQESMMTLFAPSPRILLAGLLAFSLSQLLDISVFDWVARLSRRRWLWLRTNVATLLSGLVDNILFSLFAWVILSPEPIGFYSLILTYILGTYMARALVAFLSTPIIYLSYMCLPMTLERQTKEPEPALKSAA